MARVVGLVLFVVLVTGSVAYRGEAQENDALREWRAEMEAELARQSVLTGALGDRIAALEASQLPPRSPIAGAGVDWGAHGFTINCVWRPLPATAEGQVSGLCYQPEIAAP